MKKRQIIAMLVLGIIGVLYFFCGDNSTETTPLDTTVKGKWEGYIVPITYQTLHFNGALIFLNVSGTDSTFFLVARDTTDSVTPLIKDTILVFNGSWRLDAAKDSIILTGSSCRALDTATKTLNERQVEGQRLPLPVKIDKMDGLIVWEISFADLDPLVALLGLTVTEEQKGFLEILKIALEKKS